MIRSNSFKKMGTLSRVSRYLRGEDVFIAYGRADGFEYARTLGIQLEAKGFSCYLDQWLAQSGLTPGIPTVRARKRAHLLLVVASPAACASQYVAEEVEEFHRSGRSIMPIGDERAVRGSLWANAVLGLPVTPELPQIIQNGIPSGSVVQSIEGSFRYQRHQTRIIHSLLVGTALLLLLVSGLLISTFSALEQTKLAKEQEQIALREKQNAESEASRSLASQLSVQATRKADSGDLAEALLLSAAASNTKDSYDSRDAAARVQKLSQRIRRFLWSHVDAVTSVAYSPDGKYLATGGRDKKIIIWDVASQRPKGELLAHDNWVTEIRFSKNGRTLISTGLDKRVVLWDVQTGKIVGEPTVGHKAAILSLAISPDGTTVATGGDDGEVVIWSLSTLQRLGDSLSHDYEVDCLAFSPDGSKLAVCSRDAYEWDLATRTSRPLAELGEFAHTIAYRPDGKLIAIGTGNIATSGEPQIVLCDSMLPGKNCKLLAKLPKTVLTLAFSRDGTKIAAGIGDFGSTGDETITIWDVKSRLIINEPMKGHRGAVLSLAFNPDGKTIASAGIDSSVILWDAEVSGTSAVLDIDATTNSVAFSPDGALLAIAANNSALVWDLSTKKQLFPPLLGHTEDVQSVVFSANGMFLALGSGHEFDAPIQQATDNMISVWDAKSGKKLWSITGLRAKVHQLAISHDSRLIAAAMSDKSVGIWDLATGMVDGKALTGHAFEVTSVAFSPNDKILATAAKASGEFDNDDGEIIVWDLKSRMPIGPPLKGHTGGVSTLAFSPDGKVFASGSSDGTVLLWNVETRTLRGSPMRGHYEWVRSLAFSPDSRRIVSAAGDIESKNNSIIVWDVQTLKPLGAPLNGHRNGILSVAFSPDGRTIASSSIDRTVRIWGAPMESKEWISRACHKVNRNFTQREWTEYMGDRKYRKYCPS